MRISKVTFWQLIVVLMTYCLVLPLHAYELKPQQVNDQVYALGELADNPFQGTDVLWSELCSRRYGEAGNEAMAALKFSIHAS